MGRMLVLYIPCKNKKEASHISLALLQKKLIACCNIIFSSSMYLWKGNIEKADEFIIIAKTLAAKYDSVEKEVLALHSYACPCIVALKIEKENNQYLKYLEKVLCD